MLYSSLTVNERGNLCFFGHDTVSLAEQYGTPLYIMSEDNITSRMRTYVSAMARHFGEGSMPYYASKALCIKRICQMANENGMGIDVVSGGELYTAMQAGFPMERVCFHGSSKTMAEIRMGISAGVGHFACDNPTELHRIDDVAAEMGKVQKIILRITPGIDPHTFAAVATGLIDSKFGLPIVTGQAKAFLAEALQCRNVSVEGFHCHIGSQIFETQPLADAARVMAEFAADMRDELGYVPNVIDLGGGIGVRYKESDPEVSIEDVIAASAREFKAVLDSRNMPHIAVHMEPGRSIVADSGITVYNIEDVKDIPGFRSYIAIDGGMTDNPRYALYQAEHGVMIANRPTAQADKVYTVGGRCCESGDMIRENVSLPEAQVGDKLVALTTGAYNYSMASHYNCVPKAPVVMLKGSESYVAVRRETYADLLNCQE